MYEYPDVRNATMGGFHNHHIPLPVVPGYAVARACRRHVSDQVYRPDDKNCFPTGKAHTSVMAENDDNHGLSWITDEWPVTKTSALRPFAVCVYPGFPGPGVSSRSVVRRCYGQQSPAVR